MTSPAVSPFEKRLRDAYLLYTTGSFEGALLSTVIAVAAASRIRFPDGTPSRRSPKRKMGDGEAFVTWLDEEFDRRSLPREVIWSGTRMNTNEILYKWLRCSLAHNGQLPFEIILDIPTDPRRAGFQACTRNPKRMHVHITTIVLLADFVAQSPEARPFPVEFMKAIMALLQIDHKKCSANVRPQTIDATR